MTNNDFFAPVDSVSVTDRQNAEQRLREAHRLGRIDNAEFDARMARVITAERLDELAAAVDGPLPQPSSSPYTSYTGYSEPSGAGQSYTGRSAPSSNGHPTFSGVVQSTGQSISERGTGMALLAHLSPFLT